MPVTLYSDSVEISHPSNPKTKVKILTFGATVVSWEVDGQEQLWLSKGSKLDGSRAVRGGIPLVFPRFGPPKGDHPATDKLPQHGFARNVNWELLGEVNETTIQYALGPEQLSTEVAQAWPHDFTLIYTVSIGVDTLDLSLSVENTDKKPFDFNVLYHTYFKVPTINDVAVEGLSHLEYYNKVEAKDVPKDENKAVTFDGEVDRVYKSAPSLVTITEAGKPAFTISAKNLPDVVVWNPWFKNAEAMSDFEPKDGYKQMVCVENGSVGKFVPLEPSAKWESSIQIQAQL